MHAPAYRLRAALGHSLIALITLAFVLAGSPRSVMAQAGGAQARKASEDEHARVLFEQGRQAYQDARYEEALDLFMQAYALSKRPQLLNNIGQAADRLRMDSEALDAYQRYLAEVPDAENRPAIENRIAALKVVIESNRTPSVPTPAETARAAEPASAAPAHPSPPAATQARDDDGSVLSSWWLWAGVGAAAVAGVLIGVAASGSTETVDGPAPKVDSATRVIEL